jgi:hypothetical protein
VQLCKEELHHELQASALCKLAHIYERRGQEDYAARYYQAGLDLIRDKSVGQKAVLLRAKVALCQSRAGNLGAAIKAFHELVQYEESTDDSEVKLGWLHLKLAEMLLKDGKGIEANIHFKKARKFY